MQFVFFWKNKINMRKALLSLSQEATIEIYLLTSNLLFTFLSSSSDYGDLHHHSHRRYRQGMPISHSLRVFIFSPTVLAFPFIVHLVICVRLIMVFLIVHLAFLHSRLVIWGDSQMGISYFFVSLGFWSVAIFFECV